MVTTLKCTLATFFLVFSHKNYIMTLYAVVRFLEENNTVSEIPMNWLDGDEKCWWPSHSKNISTLIAKGLEPDRKIWTSHKIFIECVDLSLESARKKAEIIEYSSSEETGRGKRKIVKKILNESSDDTSSLTGSLPIPPNLSSPILSLPDNFFDEEEQPNKNESLSRKEPFSRNSISATKDEDMQTILHILAKIQLYLKSIDERLGKIETAEAAPIENINIIKNFLPFSSIEEVMQFETMLKTNEESVKQYKFFLKTIGGRTARDTVHRILKELFKNECAALCSWKGLRNNFKIYDLKLILLIEQLILSSYSFFTKLDFEETGSEWFRFGKQRLEREKKRN